MILQQDKKENYLFKSVKFLIFYSKITSRIEWLQLELTPNRTHTHTSPTGFKHGSPASPPTNYKNYTSRHMTNQTSTDTYTQAHTADSFKYLLL